MNRQGDVLLVPVRRLRRKLTPVPRDAGRLVLAYGEITGHAHVIDAPPEEAALLTDEQERRFLRLMTAAPLVHEEHATQIIAPGTYEVRRQREYTAADMPARAVRD